MNWYKQFYTQMIIRVPGIHSRYRHFREQERPGPRYIHWFYLLWLNVRYYVFRDHSLDNPIQYDQNKKIILPEAGESVCSKLDAPSALSERLSHADCISFDVFDTLILRAMADPEDVFFMVGKALEYPGFKELRIRAEAAVRAEKKGAEVCLPEIWKLLSTWTGIDADLGMEAEFASELRICRANPYFQQLIPLLKAQNKKMIVCSDMYLSKHQIRLLLQNCGYPEFDAYFVSCDCGGSKADGSLYELVRSELGSDLYYVHIGDNSHSDQQQAEKHGFRAILYPNVHSAGRPFRPAGFSPVIGSVYSGIVNTTIHNGLWANSPAYELGFVYGGLFVTGFCQFIHAYVHTHGVDRILFLARDGEILEKVYRDLYPEDRNICRYVFWSRLSATKLCAHRFKNMFMNGMLEYKKDLGYSVSSIFHTMDLDILLEEFLHETGSGYTPASLFTDEAAGKVRAYLEQNWGRVLDHYEIERREAERYFSEILRDSSRAVAVDAGWVGSGPLMLRSLVKHDWNLNCEITGLLAGTCGKNSLDLETSEMELISGVLESYLFSSHHNQDIFAIHDAALGHNMLIELLLASTQNSFVGFLRSPDGSYQFHAEREKVDSASIQQGILDFAQVYRTHPLGNLTIPAQDAFCPIRVLYSNPEWVRKFISDSGINSCIE